MDENPGVVWKSVPLSIRVSTSHQNSRQCFYWVSQEQDPPLGTGSLDGLEVLGYDFRNKVSLSVALQLIIPHRPPGEEDFTVTMTTVPVLL